MNSPPIPKSRSFCTSLAARSSACAVSADRRVGPGSFADSFTGAVAFLKPFRDARHHRFESARYRDVEEARWLVRVIAEVVQRSSRGQYEAAFGHLLPALVDQEADHAFGDEENVILVMAVGAGAERAGLQLPFGNRISGRCLGLVCLEHRPDRAEI